LNQGKNGLYGQLSVIFADIFLDHLVSFLIAIMMQLFEARIHALMLDQKFNNYSQPF
jgi:hypothetical protein